METTRRDEFRAACGGETLDATTVLFSLAVIGVVVVGKPTPARQPALQPGKP